MTEQMTPDEVLAVLDSAIVNTDSEWAKAVRTAVATLIAERNSLREDAERLNWIDATGFTDFREWDTRTGLSSHCIIIREGGRSLGGGTNISAGIRATIDAARAEAGHG